jgi:hypothetical protein
MKLALELFDRASLLTVGGSMTEWDASVVCAGVRKLLERDSVQILVDLSNALPSPQSMELFRKLQHPRLIWIGASDELGGYADRETWIESQTQPELKSLATCLDLRVKKDSLQGLALAREKIRHLHEEKKRPLSEIEAEYLELNRTLRFVQTHLVNRVIDPVFANDFAQPDAAVSLQDRFLGLVGLSKPKAERTSRSSPRRYEPRSLTQAVDELQKEVVELTRLLRPKFIEGADRCVSLILE